MSSLKQCDICERMVKNKPDLPEHWMSLSRVSFDGDSMNFGQIDICNTCRSFLNEFYDDLENGEFVIDEDFSLKVSRAKDILRFILEGKTDL